MGGAIPSTGDDDEDKAGEMLEEEEVKEEGCPLDPDCAAIWAALARIKSVSTRLTLSLSSFCSYADPGRKNVPQTSVEGAFK